jgi:hypothetical protein
MPMLRYTELNSISALVLLFACVAAGPVHAGTCTSPTGNEADVIYSKDYHVYQFCNGTSWIAFGPGGCFAPQTGAYQPTIPSGSGYFVMSKSTFSNCNFGGLSGANTTCLTELTTNTSWAGYSAANSAGLLTSAHVRALLCDASTCNSLTPLGTYYFADANNSSHGGASFTVNSSGQGPGDSALWTATNYFGATYTFWSNVGVTSSTLWAITPAGTDGSASTCGGWTITNGTGQIGNTSSTTSVRWDTAQNYQSGPYNLICIVNP